MESRQDVFPTLSGDTNFGGHVFVTGCDTSPDRRDVIGDRDVQPQGYNSSSPMLKMPAANLAESLSLSV